jgi:peptidylprolyl isomerase domain and WD repeat-containing protein 1
MKTNQLAKLLGKGENTERFVGVQLYQGVPKNTGSIQSAYADTGVNQITAGSSSITDTKLEDPTIFTLSYKKQRFYWFSRREPKDGDANTPSRDVYNEKPLKDISKLVTQSSSSSNNTVVIHTTMGDITVQLFPKETPKTCENFTTHIKNGYYNGLTFHRIIPNFMIQVRLFSSPSRVLSFLARSEM